MAKMHANEMETDEALVQQLMAKQFPAWANLPLKRVPSSGTDNALYRLGDELVVRLPRIDWAVENIAKEVLWLPQIAPFLPYAIPLPRAVGTPAEGYPWPWTVYNWLEGSNPMVGQGPDLTQDIILFLKALHGIDLPNGPLSSRCVPLEKQDVETRKALRQLEGLVDVPVVTALWEQALELPHWTKPPVWVHGDLSPSNILTQNGRLSAVIDFGNLGIGDPACDLVIAWNFLTAAQREAFREGLEVDEPTWERGKGWALSNALIALPYYKETNPYLAKSASHVIEQLCQEPHFIFRPAQESQRALIHNWLTQPHISEWIHGIGLHNTLNGLEKFFTGSTTTTYWIGYDNQVPFAFLIAAPSAPDTIAMDVFICDPLYLEKGHAVPMIKEFLKSQFSSIKRILIDPEASNERAIHVYQKIGFKIIGEFIASWHPVPHYLMELLK